MKVWAKTSLVISFFITASGAYAASSETAEPTNGTCSQRNEQLQTECEASRLAAMNLDGGKYSVFIKLQKSFEQAEIEKFGRTAVRAKYAACRAPGCRLFIFPHNITGQGANDYYTNYDLSENSSPLRSQAEALQRAKTLLGSKISVRVRLFCADARDNNIACPGDTVPNEYDLEVELGNEISNLNYRLSLGDPMPVCTSRDYLDDLNKDGGSYRTAVPFCSDL